MRYRETPREFIDHRWNNITNREYVGHIFDHTGPAFRLSIQELMDRMYLVRTEANVAVFVLTVVNKLDEFDAKTLSNFISNIYNSVYDQASFTKKFITALSPGLHYLKTHTLVNIMYSLPILNRYDAGFVNQWKAVVMTRFGEFHQDELADVISSLSRFHHLDMELASLFIKIIGEKIFGENMSAEVLRDALYREAITHNRAICDNVLKAAIIVIRTYNKYLITDPLHIGPIGGNMMHNDVVKLIFENLDAHDILQFIRATEDNSNQYRNTKKKSCVIFGNKDFLPIPGLPEAFSFYYQEQVALLLKLRLEDAALGALNSVDILKENYILREGNQGYIAAKLSSFIMASAKDTVLIPLNIGGSHLVGIAVKKDGNKFIIHYMDSELGLLPEVLIMKIRIMLESNHYAMELRIGEIEKQKYSNCGPEVIENLTSFVTGNPRVSQEEAILQHSMALERHLLQGYQYEHTKIAIKSSIPSEKLLAQLEHYIRTGEVFDSAQAAIEDGTARIIVQSAVISNYNEEVTNSWPPSHIQTYNEDSYLDSLEDLYHTTEFSPDYSAAILGLLFSFK